MKKRACNEVNISEYLLVDTPSINAAYHVGAMFGRRRYISELVGRYLYLSSTFLSFPSLAFNEIVKLFVYIFPSFALLISSN